MSTEWVNWSGSARFTPERIAKPSNEAEIAAIVRNAVAAGRTVRPVGASHSSSGIFSTSDTLISLEKLQGLVSWDSTSREAEIAAGTTLHEAGEALGSVGLALHNLGDIDAQTVIGAISTGTHGTGRYLRNLSAALIGGRLITGTGDIIEISEDNDPDLLRAARVSLGVLGIFSSLKLQLLPAYRLRRRQWCARTEDCLEHLEELIERNQSFDFYWYPRSDEVQIRTLNLESEQPEDLPYAQCKSEQRGWMWEVIAQHRELRFEEMEYAIPIESGPECFREIRARVLERHRKTVGWRILYRTVEEDDTWLSPAHGRPTVTISLHQNASLPWRDYFDDIEVIFRSYGGRPHWGKRHSLGAAELRVLYPEWDRFQAVRRRLDPDNVFLSPTLRALLCGD